MDLIIISVVLIISILCRLNRFIINKVNQTLDLQQDWEKWDYKYQDENLNLETPHNIVCYIIDKDISLKKKDGEDF